MALQLQAEAEVGLFLLLKFEVLKILWSFLSATESYGSDPDNICYISKLKSPNARFSSEDAANASLAIASASSPSPKFTRSVIK